jgi:MoxR-like ATPase
VLRHRIVTNFNAEAEGLKPDDLIRRLIDSVDVDEDEAPRRGNIPQLFRSAGAGQS